MHIRVILGLALLFGGGLSPAIASAESPEKELTFDNAEMEVWKHSSKTSTEHYNKLVTGVLAGKEDVAIKMYALRSYYPKTPHYDPFAKSLLDKMTLYAYMIDISDDIIEVNEAADKYRNLVNEHMANIDVIDYALMLSRLDVRFGDAVFLEEVRDAIRNTWDIDLKKDGSSPDRAFRVVTYGEETYLLEKLGVKVESSEIYEVGRNFYNVHEVSSEEEGNYQLFFNVTQPIRNVSMMRSIREKENNSYIPLQYK